MRGVTSALVTLPLTRYCHVQRARAEIVEHVTEQRAVPIDEVRGCGRGRGRGARSGVRVGGEWLARIHVIVVESAREHGCKHRVRVARQSAARSHVHHAPDIQRHAGARMCLDGALLQLYQGSITCQLFPCVVEQCLLLVHVLQTRVAQSEELRTEFRLQLLAVLLQLLLRVCRDWIQCQALGGTVIVL